MPESNFVDYVKIFCRSGKGGRGSMHLHRAKYQPNGGPDGGETFIFAETITIGPYSTYAMNAMYLLATEAMDQSAVRMVRMAKTAISTYHLER